MEYWNRAPRELRYVLLTQLGAGAWSTDFLAGRSWQDLPGSIRGRLAGEIFDTLIRIVLLKLVQTPQSRCGNATLSARNVSALPAREEHQTTQNWGIEGNNKGDS